MDTTGLKQVIGSGNRTLDLQKKIMHRIVHAIANMIVHMIVKISKCMECTNEFHVECVLWTTDDGQTNQKMDDGQTVQKMMHQYVSCRTYLF